MNVAAYLLFLRLPSPAPRTYSWQLTIDKHETYAASNKENHFIFITMDENETV